MPRIEELLTGEQLAEKIKISGFTIEAWRREGRIPHFWLGHRTIRYRLSDVISALEKAAATAEAREMRAKHSQRGRVRAESLHTEMAVRRALGSIKVPSRTRPIPTTAGKGE